MKRKTMLPLKLQFFAEPPADPPEDKVVSFDDFLKREENQKEFNKRINAAIEEAEKKWKSSADDKLSEAEKLAKMTEEEKKDYLQKKKEKELADKEAEITKRELMAEAKNTLAEKKLPVSLATVLNYTNADECNKSIEAVEKAFKEAVEEAVEERLKGSAPLKKAKNKQLNNGTAGFVDVIRENQSKR